MSAKRLGVEALVILVLVLVGAGTWWWKDREAAGRLGRLEETCRAQVTAARAESEAWAGSVAAGEATAVFHAFAAGVQPAVLAGRRDSLDQAVTALLALPGVAAVHVLGADGEVLATSDRKLLATGRLDARDAWVLATTDLTIRPSDHPGVTDVAAPVIGAAGPAGYLWMSYRTDEIRDAAKPKGASPPGETAGESHRI